MITDVITSAILAVMIAAYLSFVALYDRMFPWRSSFQGRILVAQKLTLAGLAAFFIVDLFTLTGWTRDAVMIVLLLLLAYQAVATLAGLIAIYRRTREKEQP